jgi:hypothetical protein
MNLDMAAAVTRVKDYFSTENERTHPAFSVRNGLDQPTAADFFAYYLVAFWVGTGDKLPSAITQTALDGRARAFKEAPATWAELRALAGADDRSTAYQLRVACEAAGRAAYLRNYEPLAA